MHTELSEPLAIAEEVRRTREAQGLRQDELAAAAGVSTRLIHQIENAKPTTRLDGLLKVLRALGLTVTVVRRPLRRVHEVTTELDE